MPDPYERSKELFKSELQLHRGKIQGPFRSGGASGYVFNSDRGIYGEASDASPAKRVRVPRKYPTPDKPFLPSSPPKGGILNSTFTKYPEYMENPLASPERKGPSQAAPWKIPANYLGKPSPSVTGLLRNVKRELSQTMSPRR